MHHVQMVRDLILKLDILLQCCKRILCYSLVVLCTSLRPEKILLSKLIVKRSATSPLTDLLATQRYMPGYNLVKDKFVLIFVFSGNEYDVEKRSPQSLLFRSDSVTRVNDSTRVTIFGDSDSTCVTLSKMVNRLESSLVF